MSDSRDTHSIRPCGRKTHAELAREWDRLAEERERQLTAGEDLSFEHIVAPTALCLLNTADRTLVIDVGSGTGEFTARLAQTASRVVGIEPSALSAALARRKCLSLPNVSLLQASLEEAVETLDREHVTAAVASMTLMTTPDLTAFAYALGRVLSPGGVFVATLTHPCFWPRYWGYENESWFNYSKEIFVEAPFSISLRTTTMVTTHIHRPLEQYSRALTDAGFRLDSLREPMPSGDVERLYPTKWQFPRFIAFRWVKMQ